MDRPGGLAILLNSCSIHLVEGLNGVNRQTVKKVTVNRHKWQILTVKSQLKDRQN